MVQAEHEKLAVYAAALDLVARLPSILNIAEGASEFSPAETSRFYRIARRSGAERMAILDVVAAVGQPSPAVIAGKKRLLRVVTMLGGLVRRHTRSS